MLPEVDPITGLPLTGEPKFTGSSQPESFQEPKDAAKDKQIAELMKHNAELSAMLSEARTQFELANQKNTELQAQLSILSAAVPISSAPVSHPPVGASVTFVNHAGVHEQAKITGHGHRGVSLDIQGKHPNDKYKRQEIPQGGPAQALSYFVNS